jgi:integrase/recombinase XerD
MENPPFVSLFLDTRRIKKNQKYPVKLRVFTKNPRKQKLYSLNFEFTEKEFETIYLSQKPRSEHKEIRRQLQAIENKATDIAKEIKPFNFEQFEKKLFRKIGEGENVFYHYENAIDTLLKQGQIGTASNYKLSLKSIIDFCIHLKGKAPISLPFYEITPKWLQDYEYYMIENKRRSYTTVSMYIRVLRTLFNKAISEREISAEIYPFGNRLYKIPAVKNVKKTLDKSELKKLFEAEPQTPEQAKAKDFWFFSYISNGMNVKDISLLKFKNIQGDKIIYFRAKTIRTSKSNMKPIVVYLNDFSLKVIEKYSCENKSPENYVFDVINENDSIQTQHNKIKNFTRFINQNLKKLAKNNEITGEISTYWARHSFATNAIRSGASIELVSEALNHSNLKVTQGYFSGFEDETKRELMNSLMNF